MCSEMDSCPFVKKNCVVASCVNDAIIFSKDNAEIERVLQQFCDLQYDFSRDKVFLLFLGVQLQNWLLGALNCCNLTSSLPQLKSWVLVMLSHAHPQLPHCFSSTWILCHSTKASIVNQLWAFYSTLGTTLIQSVLMQLTHALNVV